MTLLEMLKKQDWYYQYCDDHKYWESGRKSMANLKSKISSLECPYSMAQLRMAVQDMVLEKFAEEEPGEWYRQPKKWACTAPTPRTGLIHEADQVQILGWIESQK